jgi:DNA-binding transcriptional regulator GbsR (MarR family)
MYICAMKLNEGKDRFIKSWGSLGSKWGINRTMAQIHALFLITSEPLSAEDIMERLKMSRGNVNMNVRTLIDWGLLFKEHKTGERKEYFRGEKDIWTITRKVISVRRQKELEPMLRVLKDLEQINDPENKNESKEFNKRIKEIKKFAEHADKTLEKFSKSEENWFLNKFIKLMIN